VELHIIPVGQISVNGLDCSSLPRDSPALTLGPV